MSYTTQDLHNAFLLGFMVTREGFNDECPLEHCAPEGLHPTWDSKSDIPEHLSELNADEKILELWNEAHRWINDSKHSATVD